MTVYSLAVVALEVRVRFQISDGIKFTQANKSNVFTTSFCVPKLSSTSRHVSIEFIQLGAQTIKAEIEGFQSNDCMDSFYEGGDAGIATVIGCSFSDKLVFRKVTFFIDLSFFFLCKFLRKLKHKIVTKTKHKAIESEEIMTF